MPEGAVVCIIMVVVLAAALCMAAYCLLLQRKYRRVEADRHCFYRGVKHQVIEIIFDRDDWFLRKVRLHTDSYPYVADVLISDVRVGNRAVVKPSNLQDGRPSHATPPS